LLVTLLLLLTATAWGDVTFYLQSETDVEDTYIKSTEATTNYGGSEDITVGGYAGVMQHILLRFPYLCDSINDTAGMIVKSADIMLYMDDYVELGTIYAYTASKPSLEDDATYNRWKTTGGNFEWGSAGANDTGVIWNETDGGGDDRGGNNVGSISVSGSGWTYLPVDTAKINDWLRADSANVDTLDVPSWIVTDSASVSLQWFHSSEHTTDTSLTCRLRVILTPAPVDEGPVDCRHSVAGIGV
jgi:hypothetical protein